MVKPQKDDLRVLGFFFSMDELEKHGGPRDYDDNSFTAEAIAAGRVAMAKARILETCIKAFPRRRARAYVCRRRTPSREIEYGNVFAFADSSSPWWRDVDYGPLKTDLDVVRQALDLPEDRKPAWYWVYC